MSALIEGDVETLYERGKPYATRGFRLRMYLCWWNRGLSDS